ncbi:MAG: LamG domain-containing protein, partial [Patescibacteria group bacterium]|nr:LamG domain-containing protein [Patescibacteria group bacterium]
SGNPDPTTYAIGSNLSITPFIHGLVGYWPLNEGSGTTAYDNSGWNNNGTLEGATDLPTWTTAGCLHNGSCLNFDGTDDYANLGSPSNFDNLNATYVTWIKTASTNYDMRILVNEATSTHNFFVVLNTGNIVIVTVQGSTTQWEQTQNTYDDGSWHMIAAVRNGDNASNAEVYIDGQQAALTTNTGNSWSMADTAKIGAKSSTQFFYTGLISLSRIYDQALSPAQIQAIYNAEKPQ